MKNLTEEVAVKKLTSNRIKVDNKMIFVKGNVGLKLLSYIEFLVNHLGYKKK